MKFTKAFRIDKTQPELDFVDIPLHTDTPLFIDPYAISKRNDIWSIECHNAIADFFQKAVDAIRNNKDSEAIQMFSKLNETNDTHLGFSSAKAQGKGVSEGQALLLYKKLKESSAVKTGFITELADCELLIEGIGPDKISDITTKIIKEKLIEYTINQCALLGLETVKVSSGYYWDREKQRWTDNFFPLPVYKNQRIILVPRAIARYEFSYNYSEYYNHFILNYLQAEHLNANSSLVQTLKKGRRVVYKKTLKEREEYPCSKEFIYKFSRQHPKVLEEYKKRKGQQIKDETVEELVKAFDVCETSSYLTRALKSIASGDNEASKYHDLIIGITEFIFYPLLNYPRKEEPIHGGRKRIDICFNNAASDDFFFHLHKSHEIPCHLIMVECKNYKGDPKNPELDQLSGRFGVNRGCFGFLICRRFDDKKLFIERCKDTHKDGRGIIMALDDDDIVRLLSFKADKNDKEIDRFFNLRFREILTG